MGCLPASLFLSLFTRRPGQRVDHVARAAVAAWPVLPPGALRWDHRFTPSPVAVLLLCCFPVSISTHARAPDPPPPPVLSLLSPCSQVLPIGPPLACLARLTHTPQPTFTPDPAAHTADNNRRRYCPTFGWARSLTTQSTQRSLRALALTRSWSTFRCVMK